MQLRARRLAVSTTASVVGLLLAFSALAEAALTPAEQALKQKRNRPNLIVSAVQEPPDFAAPGDVITLNVTVANEGRSRAKRSTLAQVQLSSGRAPSSDDIRMPGRGTIPALSAGQEVTRQIRATIPATTPAGAYYFVACSDVTRRVREYEEGLIDCKLSGQAVDLRNRPVGPPGPTGAPGPDGPAGTRGDIRQMPRTELDLGDRLFEPDPSDPGDDEGSTQISDALTVGPLTIRYLCRQTTNGDSGEPGVAFGNPDSFDEDGDEAKVLVYGSEGTFSFSSPNGQRMNIPAGSGEAGRDDEAGGEGKRQIISATHDPDPNTTRHRRDGPENDGTEPEYQYGFKSGSAYIAHSSGTEIIVNVWAGIDVLGVGNDRCVFGGTAQVVQG